MASNPQQMSLGEVLSALIDHRGRTPKKLGGDFSAAGVPVISAVNVKDGRLVFDGEPRHVTHEMHRRWMPDKLQVGDVILTSEAPLGEVAYLRDEANYCLGQRLFALRAHPTLLDSRFLYYVLCSAPVQQQLHSRATGTTAQGIRQSELVKVVLDLPPLPEQHAIARILGALDDKIELNRRMNETLEAIARALFQSWFVDFDPVRAKAEGRHPAGMDAATAALFPDAFEESPLGPIPRGWRVVALGDVISVVLGGDWGKDTPSDDAPEAVLCIRGADIPGLQGGGEGDMPIRYLKPSSLAKRRLTPDDIVLEVSGGSPTQSTGRPVLIEKHMIQTSTIPMVCSNFCRMLRLNPEVSPKYAYLWLRRTYEADEFLQYENGTTGIKNLALNTFLQQHPLLIPRSDVLAQFEQTVAPLFISRQVNGAQNVTLAAMRDALLPKLLSGEVRVREAEALVEAAI